MKRLKTLNMERVQIKNQPSFDHMVEIIKAVGQIDCLTDHLGVKLSALMKKQQNQFVQAYKQHMKKIRQQVQLLKWSIQVKDQKIKSYESEGKAAEFLKRINFLQQQQIKLLDQINKKNQIIKLLNLEKQINKNENQRLQQRIKEFIQSRAKSLNRLTNQIQHYKSTQTFQTQISPEIETSTLQKLHLSGIKSKKHHNAISQKYSFTVNPEKISEVEKLHKQMKSMQKQIKNLTKSKIKICEQYKEAQNFFLSAVSEMKRSIMTRKKFKYCSYEDFRKEDKIQLLIKILSNDQILICLYNKIFGKMPPQTTFSFDKSYGKFSKSGVKVQFKNLKETRQLQ